jgi:hypothetical protein
MTSYRPLHEGWVLTLNDVQLGQTANMHRSYAYAVRHLLVEGQNRLRAATDRQDWRRSSRA